MLLGGIESGTCFQTVTSRSFTTKPTNPTDSINQTKKQQVRAILLDPSCSGSGMVASLERQFDGSRQAKPGQPKKGDGPPGAEAGRNWRAGVKDGGPTARLKALAQFQYKALTKAFSFPQVRFWWHWHIKCVLVGIVCRGR